MKVLITGGTGMVGSAFSNIESAHNLVLVGSKDYNLVDREECKKMLDDICPDAVIHLAARVGGVKGNLDYVSDFFYENITMNTNLLNSAREKGVQKVVSLLSTCVYPDKVDYPLTEDQIHNGEPHSSNFGYAYAKRMLDVQSRASRQQYGCNFICAIPNNLYGPHDNFDLENGHVIPAIIRKVWQAKLSKKSPVFWGDGSPLREFTYAPDIAKILLYLLEEYNNPEPINIGITNERSISSVVDLVRKELDANIPVTWDISRPAGQFRKPSSNKNLLKLGWKENDYTTFEDGIRQMCKWFSSNYPNVRGVEI